MESNLLQPVFIKGGFFEDKRGSLEFVNLFDMSRVQRFYMIEHPDTSIQRGWQGHRIEEKSFYPLRGAFSIAVVKPDDWQSPSPELPVELYDLNVTKKGVLQVPAGYATSMRALYPGSKLIVFSTLPLEEAVGDDYRFPAELWNHSNHHVQPNK